jgi:adenylate cyclase
VTAIGDAVNTASRLEVLTKTYGCQLVVSEQVARRAGADFSSFASHQIEVRGRRNPLTIRVVADARDLPDFG